MPFTERSRSAYLGFGSAQPTVAPLIQPATACSACEGSAQGGFPPDGEGFQAFASQCFIVLTLNPLRSGGGKLRVLFGKMAGLPLINMY